MDGKRLIDCPDCGEKREHKARGVCRRCYARRREAGDVTAAAPPPAPRVQTVPQIDGLSYRQLHYWATKGWLRPDNPNPGTGRNMTWPPAEIAVAHTMARLIDAGLNVDAASRVARGDTELAPGIRVLVEAQP